MWFFSKTLPPKDYKSVGKVWARETTFLDSRINNGKPIVIEAGIQEHENGAFRAWVGVETDFAHRFIYPAQSITASRERAIQLAEILGKAHKDFLDLATTPESNSNDRSE